MSRRIVLNCFGSYGDVYPYIGLAIALKRLGHRPLIATLALYREAVQEEGIDFAPVGSDTADPLDRELIGRLMHPVKGPERVIRDLVMPLLRESFEQLARASDGADFLVGHPLAFGVSILAEQRSLPWAATILAPLGLFSVSDLPALPAAPWAVHLRGLGTWFGRFIVAIGRRATREWVEPVARLRKELGLPERGHPLFEGQFSPTLNLALFSRVLAKPQPDWPPHMHTTGFVFYNGRATMLDGDLEAFLAAGPPPVVFTLGTSAVAAAGSFYEESVAAVSRLGVRAVLLAGSYAENRPSTLPPGMMLVDRAPHDLLFPRASAIVHQGGSGTTAQALRSGHPMIVVPHGHDQPDNAFRVKNLGVARTIFPPRYRRARVARELDRILMDGSFAERAAAVAQTVRSEGGADEAARIINDQIANLK